MKQYTTNIAINTFLNENDSTFERIINAIEKSLEQSFTSKQRDFEKICLHYKVIKSMSKFILTDDKLITSTSRYSKTEVVFNAEFIRNNESFYIDTKQIYASGHIQRLHLRYLTNCTIPAINKGKEIEKEFKAKIAKLTKEEKLLQEINQYEMYIAKNQYIIDTDGQLNNEQIHQVLSYTDEDYQICLSYTYEKNGDHFNSFDEWKNKIDMYLDDKVSSFRKRNLSHKENDIKSFEKSIEQLKRKLEKLRNS